MRNHWSAAAVRRGRTLVAVGAVLALSAVVTSPAQAVTIGSATTNFEVEATALAAANASHSEWVVPGAAPATDWAGSGMQAVPNLMVFNDTNYTGSGATVPSDLSPAAIQATCTGSSDDAFGSGEKIKTHPIAIATSAPSADKADICQVFTGYETATNSVNAGIDVIFYLGFTANGNANSTGSVKFWYELNQADDVSNTGNYRSVGDVLIGFQYVGGSAGTVDAYTWSGSDWTSVTLPSGSYTTSTPPGVSFAELAINLTASGVVPRPTSPTGCQSFVAGRGMTSASAQTTSAGKDATAVYPLTNAVSTCGQIRVTKQTLPEDPNSATVGYPGNAAFGTFPIQISGGPSGATTLTGSAADNSTVGFVELYGAGYTVTETSVTAGFTATSFTCTKNGMAVGTTAANFMSVSGLTASSTPTDCVVTNAKNPTLSIKKQSTGPTGSFNFNLYSSSNLATALSGSPLAVSTVSTNPNTTAWPSTLAVGSYVLKEANPSPTYLLTSFKCTVTKGDASAAVVTTGDLVNGVAFTVAGGDSVLCEAFNKGDLSISISKTTLPAGGTGFDFTSSTAPTSFSLNDADERDFAGLVAGTYTFTEAAEPGYYLKAINCSGTAAANVTTDLTARSVAIAGAVGEDISCEFVNEKLAKVSVTKSVTGATGAWSFNFSLSPAGSNTNPRAVTNLVPTTTWIDLVPGSFTMTESTVPAGFEAGTLTCGAEAAAATTGVSFTLAAGDELACTADNTELGSLTIEKQTDPDGHAETFDFTTTDLTPASFDLFDNGTEVFADLAPDTYVVNETSETGWALDDVTCTGATASVITTSATGVSVELAAGEDVTCTFENSKTPRLKVVKTVVNDDGGEAVSGDFALTAQPLGSVVSGATNEVVAGTEYVVSEEAVAGYEQTSIECVDVASAEVGTVSASAVTLTLAAGDDVTCTIENDDIAPTLKVVKAVNNDAGGNAAVADFALEVSGIGAVLSGAVTEVMAGETYTVSETQLSGYSQESLVCLDDDNAAEVGSEGVVMLTVGQNVTCTITNDDIAPSLKVIKSVVTDNGGDEEAGDFELLVSPGVDANPIVSENVYRPLANVEYTVSETDFAGYTQTSLECIDDDTAAEVGVDGVLTLTEGQNVTCTIENDDIAPQLTVVKVVDNNDGGDEVADDFELSVSGGVGLVSSGVPESVTANVEYSVSENLTNMGYEQVGIECVDDNTDAAVGSDGSVTLGEGQNVTCTITNDDIAPKLTVIKNVVTDNGGDEVIADFELSVSPAVSMGAIVSGEQYSATANVEYTVSEDLAGMGYEQTSIECVDDVTDLPVGADGVVRLAEAQAVTCTVTNDDIAPRLTVVKTVVTDDGGDEVVADFELLVSPVVKFGAIVSGEQYPVAANVEYTVSETLLDGYAQTSIVCVDEATDLPVGADGVLTLSEAQDVVCTITNDDVAPTLTVVKDVVTDDGGNEVVSDFELSVSPAVGTGAIVSGDRYSVAANVEYTVSETVLDGYTQTSIECADELTDLPVGTDGVLTLIEGQSVTCTITNDDVAPTLTVVKEVDNDDGGNAEVDDFALSVSGIGSVASGDAETVEANVEYTVSEDLAGIAGYQQVSIECVDDGSGDPVGLVGSVMLDEGQSVTCTILNDDEAPKLTVVKELVIDNGGNEGVDDFELLVSPSISLADVVSGTQYLGVSNTEYTVSETALDGYIQTSIECVDDTSGDPVGAAGVLTMDEGQEVTCTITNEDVAPELTVVKSVVNDNGGDAVAGDFALAVSGIGSVTTGVTEVVEANVEYTVSETQLDGYEQESIECIDDVTMDAVGVDGVLTLDEGQTVTCTITNTDIAPKLTIVKNLLVDDGGNEVTGDFALSVAPAVSMAPIVSGVQYDVQANVEYTVSEMQLAGYQQVGIECTDDDTNATVGSGGVLTLAAEQNVTCTITNDDVAPSLTVIKELTVDDGGDEVVADFELSVASSAGSTSAASGQSIDVKANVEYTVSETRLDGYEQTSLECVDDDEDAPVGADGVLTLAEGQNVTCTITNDDTAPTLTIVKDLTVDNGGNEVVSDFVLSASPSLSTVALVSGTSYSAEANVEYTVSETQRVGYSQTSLVCVDDDTDATVGSSGVLTLDEGQHVTCTITNNDVAPSLKVVKEVVNDHGGNAVVGDFPLSVASSAGSVTVTSGAARSVSANVEYTVSETQQAGYAQTSLSCVDDDTDATIGADGVLTLTEGQDVTCTITNDDIAPTLKVVKQLTANDGGNEAVADFVLSVAPWANADPIVSGTAYAAQSNVQYTVSETQRAGYSQTALSCVDNDTAAPVGVAGALTLEEGQDVTCTITNDDIAPTLTVVKSVVNDNGGNAVVGDFPLSVASSAGSVSVTSGAARSVSANVEYTVSETQQTGYAQTSLVCVDNATSAAVGAMGVVTLAEGQNVTCTIVNDDIAGEEVVDLSITKRDLADDVLAGTSVTYELVVDNVGSGTPTANATVTDQLPVELVWPGAPVVAAPNGVTCAAPVGQMLTCAIPGTLLDPSDEPVVIQLQASVRGDVRPTTVQNLAFVDHPQDPCLPVNGAGACTPTLPPGCDSAAPADSAQAARVANVDCEFTTIKPNFDVKIAVSYVGPAMGPGSTGSFELVIVNNGPGTAFDVVLTDPLPGPLVVTNARGETQECGFVGNVVTCSRGALAPGETWRITVAVQLPTTAGAMPANYSNVASITALGDEVPSNNVDSAAVPPLSPLPATGADIADAMRFGWILLLGGGLLLVAGRRRRRDEAVQPV